MLSLSQNLSQQPLRIGGDLGAVEALGSEEHLLEDEALGKEQVLRFRRKRGIEADSSHTTQVQATAIVEQDQVRVDAIDRIRAGKIHYSKQFVGAVGETGGELHLADPDLHQKYPLPYRIS